MLTPRRNNWLLPVIAAAAAVWSACTAMAGDAPGTGNGVNTRVDRAWQFIVAPYFVGANITGTSQIGRLPSTNIDVGTNDILENLHFGGMILAEALYKDRFGAFVDVAYMKLGDARDILATGGRARVGVSQLIVETMLTYRFFRSANTHADLYAGSRYWDISLDVDVTGSIAGTFNATRGDSWWDPVIGVRGSHDLTDKWLLKGRADIGGFGLASDLTWNLQGGAGYRFNDVWTAHLQYKVLSVDYDNGRTGPSSFAYDAITHGPVLGVAAKF